MAVNWANLITSKPVIGDGDELDVVDDAAQIVEADEEVSSGLPSGLPRGTFSSILEDDDPRYRGRKASRKSLLPEGSDAEPGFPSGDEDEDETGEDEDEDETGEDEDEDETGEDEDGHASEDEGEGVGESDSNNESDSSSEVEEEDEYASEEDEARALNSLHEKEVLRGRKVQEQLRTFETLLEIRIRLQHILSKTQLLPAPKVLNHFLASNSDGMKSDLVAFREEACRGTSKLVKECELLQTTVGGSRKCKKENAASCYRGIRERRDGVVERWDERTRIGKRGKVDAGGAVALARQTLADRRRMVDRTRVWRKEEKPRRIQEEEIFDDTDFYQQLLREVIERKTTDAPNVGLEIEKLRKNLRKKKEGSGSNKGRTPNYEPIPKLQNFMAPVLEASEMSDVAKNELFSSLFGKVWRSGDDAA